MAESERPLESSQVPSQGTESQTAQEYIAQQLQLEADAKEALPYQFDTCTKPLGPLRQLLFSCLTCSPPPKDAGQAYEPAGVCYSCSISCHGEHELVELFSKRDFACDCGTTRLPSACSLRSHPTTGVKGDVKGEEANSSNTYNHNFQGRFCACGELYDPAKEKGTMFQCLGMGSVADGGCGEDWWHPECLVGLDRLPSTKAGGVVDEAEITLGAAADDQPRDLAEQDVPATLNADELPLPVGFPAEDDFEHLVCFKCVQANPWIKPYAGTSGFLDAVYREKKTSSSADGGAKRKHDDDDGDVPSKRIKFEIAEAITQLPLAPDAAENPVMKPEQQQLRHALLPQAADGTFSLFLQEDFREHFCRCPECFPRLSKHPQLLEEEEPYEPPLSESDPGDANGGSVGSRSLLDRGEAALSTMDRMRAIEGVLAYNHLKDKVKAFLQPFADSGQTVGAEDVKQYFARLRGDEDALRQATVAPQGGGDDGDSRREQSGF